MDRSPEIVEFVQEVAGIYFRSVLLKKKGMRIPQHVHSESHATYIGAGKVRLYVDYDLACDVEAGNAVEIQAGKRHWFEALEDNTRITCVWSLEAAERQMKSKGI